MEFEARHELNIILLLFLTTLLSILFVLSFIHPILQGRTTAISHVYVSGVLSIRLGKNKSNERRIASFLFAVK